MFVIFCFSGYFILIRQLWIIATISSPFQVHHLLGADTLPTFCCIIGNKHLTYQSTSQKTGDLCDTQLRVETAQIPAAISIPKHDWWMSRWRPKHRLRVGRLRTRCAVAWSLQAPVYKGYAIYLSNTLCPATDRLWWSYVVVLHGVTYLG